MTGTPPLPDGPEARLLPALYTREQQWLTNYLERLKHAPGRPLKRVVVYGSKARGDAGPKSDLDVLVLVDGSPDAVRSTSTLAYGSTDPNGVEHNVVVHTEADWMKNLEKELPFPRNVEGEGIQIYPVYKPAKRPPGDQPPVTLTGMRHAIPAWLEEAHRDLTTLEQEIQRIKTDQHDDPGRAARPAFDAVFFSAMAWCLTRNVSTVRRKDLPTTVERNLIGPGALDPEWLERIRTLHAAWDAETNWRPGASPEPTTADAVGWAESAERFNALAREAIATAEIEP